MRAFPTFLRACIVLLAIGVGSGCAPNGGTGGSRTPHGDAPPAGGATLVVEPVRVEGGQFIEGFIAGTDVDGEYGAISEMTALDEPARYVVEPGTRRVHVLVYPCEAMCRPWAEFADRYEAELAEPGDMLRPLGRLVTECHAEVEISESESVRLTPVIDLGDVARSDPTCAFETDR